MDELYDYLLEHDTEYLRYLLVRYNMNITCCVCKNCLNLEYFDDSITEDEYMTKDFDNFESDNCKFLKELKDDIQNHGLTYSYNSYESHFKIDKNWSKIDFGNKIINAGTIYDDDIIKYKNFINYLLMI
jgi:hypothetical protein